MLVLNSRSNHDCSSDHPAISATRQIRSGLISFFHLSMSFVRRKGCRFLLAFCWIAGLIGGIGLCHRAGPSLVSWMRGVWDRPVSIGRLFAITELPFLLSALAVYASHPRLLYGLAFARGLTLSFVAVAVQLSWGQAGWLARWLLCFGSFCSAPVLYGYWLRHIGRRRAFSFWEAALLVSFAGAIGSIHFFIIAPLLARLIHF